jgi:hypothetical protein
MPASKGWPNTSLPALPDSEFPKDDVTDRRKQVMDDVRPILEILTGQSGNPDQPLPDLTPNVRQHLGDSWPRKDTSDALNLFLSDVAGKDPDQVMQSLNAQRLELILDGLMQLGRKLTPH